MPEESDRMDRSVGVAADRAPFHTRLLDALGNAVIATDLESRILYWNQAAHALYGWEPDEAIGRPLAEVAPARFTPEQEAQIDASLASGHSWRGEATAYRRDGTAFATAIVTSPLHDGSGTLIGSVSASWENRSTPSTDRAARLAPGEGETVLLVDDEMPVRKFAQRLLHRIGYQVLEASNGEEALELATHHPGPIHLLLTDLTMPRMGGRELAIRMSERRPGTHVVFMSGYAEGGVLPASIGGVDTAFVAKPFTIDALASTVRRSLDIR